MVIRHEWEHPQEPGLLQVLEVVHGLKQIALKVLVSHQGRQLQALYRPEKTLRLAPDIRIPLPQELYRDACYTMVSEYLGWGVSAPAEVWSLRDNDCGVLRPYYAQVENLQHYNFTEEFLRSTQYEFWIKLAVLDYITAVIDRNYNDILFVLPENDTWRTASARAPQNQRMFPLNGKDYHAVVVDSGLSFVPGTEFVTQSSLLRSLLKGHKISPEVLKDLQSITPQSLLLAKLKRFLGPEELAGFTQRIAKILSNGTIL